MCYNNRRTPDKLLYCNFQETFLLENSDVGARVQC